VSSRWTIAAVVLLGFVMLAAAQDRPCPSCQEAGGCPPGPAALDLSAEQQKQMDELRMANVKEMVAYEAELQVKRVELDALWRAENPSAKEIIAKAREISGLREKMQVARINHAFAQYNLLTAEQKEKVKGLGPRMFERGHGMRGMRGMGRGMPGCGMMQGMQGMPGPGGCGGCGPGGFGAQGAPPPPPPPEEE